MTKKQAIWASGIGVAVAAAMVLAHGNLPVDASWRTNRVLHYSWQGLVGLVAVGAVVWLLWPRPKAARRDLDREIARRRVIGMGVVVVAAVILAIFGEVRRELVTRRILEGLATQELHVISEALTGYERDHGGAMPARIEDLVPKYLEPGRLSYAYRAGPIPIPPPDASDETGAVQSSFALAKAVPGVDQSRRGGNRIVAYLRPGHAWAPLTVVLEKDGKVQIVGEDVVGPYEEQAQPK
jgi:hypothetical protein